MPVLENLGLRVTPDGRMSRNDAATFLGFRPKTLAEWHRLGIGPRSILVGGRRFYKIDDLRSFVSGDTSAQSVAA